MNMNQPTAAFEDVLRTLQTAYANTPYTQSFVESLIANVQQYREQNNTDYIEQSVIDLITLLNFFELRLQALEDGQPAPQ